MISANYEEGKMMKFNVFNDLDVADWCFILAAPIVFGIAWGASHAYFTRIFSEIIAK